MVIDVLQHVSFEGPAAIEEWSQENGHELRVHKLFDDERLPSADDIDFLIILGGPMSANDTSLSWIEEERELIKQVLDNDKPMLGICLGAQQMAKALGATIFQGEFKEVGWREINSFLKKFDFLPDSMTVFHWHGEQFELPEGSHRLFGNSVCENQGFLYKDRVVGLQFHFESTPASISSLIENERAYLDESPYVQTEEFIKNFPIPSNNKQILYAFLDTLSKSNI